MTTIATNGSYMAADGRTTGGNEILSDRTVKIHHLPDGSVIGGSGESIALDRAVGELAAAISEHRKPEPLKGKYRLLRLTPKGKVLMYHEELYPIEVDVPAAIGSGGDYARGAMEFGADPVTAVRIAKKIDPATGGKVRALFPK